MMQEFALVVMLGIVVMFGVLSIFQEKPLRKIC